LVRKSFSFIVELFGKEETRQKILITPSFLLPNTVQWRLNKQQLIFEVCITNGGSLLKKSIGLL
jgi:hypothetical protein